MGVVTILSNAEIAEFNELESNKEHRLLTITTDCRLIASLSSVTKEGLLQVLFDDHNLGVVSARMSINTTNGLVEIMNDNLDNLGIYDTGGIFKESLESSYLKLVVTESSNDQVNELLRSNYLMMRITSKSSSAVSKLMMGREYLKIEFPFDALSPIILISDKSEFNVVLDAYYLNYNKLNLNAYFYIILNNALLNLK